MKPREFLPRFLVVVMLTILPTLAIAADPEPGLFQKDSFAAWQTAQLQNRPLLVYFTTDACLHCKKMEQYTFKDQHVKSDIQRSFVAMVVRPADQLPLLERLGVRTYPTTAVIAPNGEVLAQMSGYVRAADFRVKLEKCLRGVRTAAKP